MNNFKVYVITSFVTKVKRVMLVKEDYDKATGYLTLNWTL